MSLRQLGFALNVYDGPLSIFLTTNFADMYSPITVVLMNGAGEPLGKREVNLLDNEPCMPTLQAMHRALAKHPMLQVELFLVLHGGFYRHGAIWHPRKANGSRRRLCKQPPDWHSSVPTLGIEAAGGPRAWLHAWSRKNHFRAANESCASEAVVYECWSYRARRKRTQQMVPAIAGSGAAGGLYFAI